MAKHKTFNNPYIAQPSDTTRSLNPRCGIRADVLVVGSTCHKQLGRLFYFTGTTEQGTSGAAGISETAEFSKCEQQ